MRSGSLSLRPNVWTQPMPADADNSLDLHSALSGNARAPEGCLVAPLVDCGRRNAEHARQICSGSGLLDCVGDGVGAHGEQGSNYRLDMSSPIKAKSLARECHAWFMEKHKDFGDRLMEALDYRGYPPLYQGRPERLSKEMNVSSTAAAQWMHGKKRPAAANAAKLATLLEISADWLQNGTGKMVPDPPLTEDEQSLLDIYKKMTPDQRERFRQVGEVLADYPISGKIPA